VQPRLRPPVARGQLGRAVHAALDDRQPGRGRAEAPRHADEIAGAGAVAADQQLLPLGPADHGHRDRQHRPAREVAARERHAEAVGERSGAAVQREDVLVGHRVREHDGQVRLAPGRAHRGEVGERAGQRAVARVLGRDLAEAEVGAVDHRVDGDGGERLAAHDGAVVADPAHDPRVPRPRQRRLDGGDQLALAH
jgi:hypothetical protein